MAETSALFLDVIFRRCYKESSKIQWSRMFLLSCGVRKKKLIEVKRAWKFIKENME